MLYEDGPKYGLILRLIMVLLPGALLVGSIVRASAGNSSSALVLLLEAAFLGLIFWLVFPHRYQIYSDYVRIVLGGPFTIKVRFAKIRSVGTSSGISFGVSFVTAITKNYVAIVHASGIRINITPRHKELFIKVSAFLPPACWGEESGLVRTLGRSSLSHNAPQLAVGFFTENLNRAMAEWKQYNVKAKN